MSILVDSSVWIDYFRGLAVRLEIPGGFLNVDPSSKPPERHRLDVGICDLPKSAR